MTQETVDVLIICNVNWLSFSICLGRRGHWILNVVVRVVYRNWCPGLRLRKMKKNAIYLFEEKNKKQSLG